ncbi:unnamed protein product [marine sediment metagenome]|uniref:Uncharacterized protein n=1 Tax=marine sediment metagenome TaxID=412755 RepID=X1PRX7_9ZZZZ
MNDMSDCPVDAITNAFLEKLIFTIIEPAFTNEFELATKPVENSCQKAIPNMA